MRSVEKCVKDIRQLMYWHLGLSVLIIVVPLSVHVGLDLFQFGLLDLLMCCCLYQAYTNRSHKWTAFYILLLLYKLFAYINIFGTLLQDNLPLFNNNPIGYVQFLLLFASLFYIVAMYLVFHSYKVFKQAIYNPSTSPLLQPSPQQQQQQQQQQRQQQQQYQQQQQPFMGQQQQIGQQQRNNMQQSQQQAQTQQRKVFTGRGVAIG